METLTGRIHASAKLTKAVVFDKHSLFGTKHSSFAFRNTVAQYSICIHIWCNHTQVATMSKISPLYHPSHTWDGCFSKRSVITRIMFLMLYNTPARTRTVWMCLISNEYIYWWLKLTLKMSWSHFTLCSNAPRMRFISCNGCEWKRWRLRETCSTQLISILS